MQVVVVLEAGLEQRTQVVQQGQLQVVSKQLAVFEQQVVRKHLVVDKLLVGHVQLVVVQLVGGKSLEHRRTLNLQFDP